MIYFNVRYDTVPFAGVVLLRLLVIVVITGGLEAG